MFLIIWYFVCNVVILIMSAIINYPFDYPERKLQFALSVLSTLFFGVLMVLVAVFVIFIGTLLNWFDESDKD